MKHTCTACGLLILLSAYVLSSCMKKEFDAPPDQRGFDPGLAINITIKQLKGMISGPVPLRIDADYVLAAVVTADDRTGNIYKQLVIEDDSAGIHILLDANNLYGDYPAGRKIYVKLKGLYIGTYSNLPQIGFTPDNTGSITSIPATLINNYLVKASFPHPVEPVEVSMDDVKSLNPGLLNRLIRIHDVQVIAADTGRSWAQSPQMASATNISLEDCDGIKIIVRSSGYASFQAARTPKGKGSITAVYTVFNSTPQLILRDTSDAQMREQRCGITSGTIVFSQDFEAAGSGTLNLPGWTNFAEAGGKKWTVNTFGGTKFALISAYNTNQAVVKSWLITPAVDLNGLSKPVLSFRTIDGYDNGASLKVYASMNYSGSGNPTAASWAPLSGYALSGGHTSGYASGWTKSGDVSLSAFSGTIHIAFVYEGEDPAGSSQDKTTTFEVDNILVYNK